MAQAIDKLAEKAAMADMAREDAFGAVAPDVELSKPMANRLITSVNDFMKMIGGPVVMEAREDIMGPLPVDLYKSLMMLSDIFEDSRMDKYQFDPTEIATDRDVIMLNGKLQAAAKDNAVKSFLMKPMEGETEVEVSIEKKPAMGTIPEEGMHVMPDGTLMSSAGKEDMMNNMDEEDYDEMFMSRMK